MAWQEQDANPAQIKILENVRTYTNEILNNLNETEIQLLQLRLQYHLEINKLIKN